MKIRNTTIRNFVLSYGFLLVLVLMFIGYSVGTKYFFTLDNIMGIFHVFDTYLCKEYDGCTLEKLLAKAWGEIKV